MITGQKRIKIEWLIFPIERGKYLKYPFLLSVIRD